MTQSKVIGLLSSSHKKEKEKETKQNQKTVSAVLCHGLPSPFQPDSCCLLHQKCQHWKWQVPSQLWQRQFDLTGSLKNKGSVSHILKACSLFITVYKTPAM